MTKRGDRAIVLLFVIFLGAFFLLNLALPDKDFSPQENRYLQTLPDFSFSALFRGSYTRDFEAWCSDQFTGRDFWISLKARLELLQGKGENNGIFLCEGERLLEPFAAPEGPDLDRRILAVNMLAENAGVPVTLGLIPTAAELYADLLPEGARNDSQREIISYINARTAARTADLASPLSQHSGEPVFYRTDHHWTSLGAFYGYQALGDALGYVPNGPGSYTPEIVSEDFCGTAYSSSGFFWISPDEMEIFRPAPEDLQIERYENGVPVPGRLYAPEMLETKDKYRFFLGGNTSQAVIRTGNEGLPSLLILRDSYTDSLIPFLLDHFSEIHLLDLRYFRGSVLEYIQESAADQVLILYSVSNFCQDTNLALMTR